MTWPVTQRFVFSQSTEQTVPNAKANSPLNAPVLLMVFSVGLLIVPFSCSSMVYSVLGFLGAGFLLDDLRFFCGSSSSSTMSSSSSSSSDSDLRGDFHHSRRRLLHTTGRRARTRTPSRTRCRRRSGRRRTWVGTRGSRGSGATPCWPVWVDAERSAGRETARQTAAPVQARAGAFRAVSRTGGRVATLEQRRRRFYCFVGRSCEIRSVFAEARGRRASAHIR